MPAKKSGRDATSPGQKPARGTGAKAATARQASKSAAKAARTTSITQKASGRTGAEGGAGARAGGKGPTKPRGRPSEGRGKAAARTAVVPLGIHDWLRQIADLHEETFVATDAAAAGACLVSNAQTGATYCVLTSPQACATMKGTYLGGACG